MLNRIFKRSLLENINLKFFRITHLLTLEEKRDIFLQKYKTTAEILGENSIVKNEYILNYLSPTIQKTVDTELLAFKSMQEIDDYSFSLCTRLSTQYDNIQLQVKTSTNNASQAWSLFDHITPGTFIAVSFVIIIVVGTIYYFGSSGIDAVKKSGELQGNINGTVSNISTNATQAFGTTATTNTDLGLQFQTLSEATKLQGDTILNLVENNTTKIIELESKQQALANVTNIMFTKIKGLFKLSIQMQKATTFQKQEDITNQLNTLLEQL
jgi:hypothetical protein